MTKLPHYLSLFLLAGWSQFSLGLTLQESYQAALKNDPQFLAQIEEQQIAATELDIARARLLPDLSLSASEYLINDRSRQTLAASKSHTTSDSTSGRVQITARQSLLDLRSWHLYKAGQLKGTLGEQILRLREQEMILRLVTYYLDAVAAQTQLSVKQAEVISLQRQQQQAEHNYAAGEGTITDLDDVSARSDLTRAQMMQTEDNFKIYLLRLKQQTGISSIELLYLNPFQPLDALKTTEVANIPFEKIQANNPTLQAYESQIKIAREQLSQARAGHTPTLQLVAIARHNTNDDDSHTSSSFDNPIISDSVTDQNSNQNSDQRYIGLELQLPLFSGLGVNAVKQQASHKYTQTELNARAALLDERSKAEESASRITSGIAQINSLKRAVESARKTRNSMTLGETAGLRTLTDVLDAESRVFDTYRELTLTEIEVLKNYAKFQASMGMLNLDTIAFMEQFLSTLQHPIVEARPITSP